MRTSHNISRIVTWLAGGIIIISSILPPLGFFLMSYQNIHGSLETEAEILAGIITAGVINVNPEMWEYETIRLEEILARRRLEGYPVTRRIFNMKNDLVAESVLELLYPSTKGKSDLMDSGEVVGQIEVTRSLRPVVIEALLITMVTVSLGFGLFIILRVVPIKAMARSENALWESEEKYRTLIETANDAILVIDQGSEKIIDVNRKAEDLLGNKKIAIIGMSLADLFSGKDEARFKSDFIDMIVDGQSKLEELNVVRKDGQRVPVEISISISEIKGKKIVHGIFRDITERKRTEQQLKTFMNKLEQSNQDLQDFAYTASHDLQEPLRKVMAFGERLKTRCGDSLDDQGRQYLERMQDAAGRMSALINGLLTLSRVATKGAPFVAVNLGHIASEVVSDLDYHIDKTGGRVEIGDLPTIEADPLQMRQLFQNLIGNALKFRMTDKPPMVKIYVESVTGQRGPEDRLCRIIVKDNGIGFDQKYAEQIFKVFQRLHGRDEYEGTGIGLSVCLKIIKRHGGTIVAESAPGKGATFILTLPANTNARRA